MNRTYSRYIDTYENYNTWNFRTFITLIICIAIPLIIGGISSFLTRDGMIAFTYMNKPPLAPPAWLFPIAWSILYVLMGIASFLIYRSSDDSHYIGIVLYSLQLIFNFVWSLIFFKLNAYTFAFVWLAMLLFMIVALIVNTAKYSKPAMIMLLPYAAWCGFALYLNIGIAILN